MNKNKRAILTALALGDGSLSKPDKWNSVSIDIEHCEKQKDYIEYKYDLLHKLTGGKKVKLHRRVRTRKGTQLTSYRFRKAYKYFRILRKRLYKNNKKTYSIEILNYLNDLGVAIWIMDDGSLTKRYNKDGSVKSCQFKLSICESKEGCKDIIKFFKERYNANFKIVKHMKSKTDKQLYSILANTSNYRKVSNCIYPYVLDSMKYKVLPPRVQSIQNG